MEIFAVQLASADTNNYELAALYFTNALKSEVANVKCRCIAEIGLAKVVVRAIDGTVSQGTVQVVPVAPSLFAANSDGQGVSVGNVVRVKPSGAQSFEPVSPADLLSYSSDFHICCPGSGITNVVNYRP